MVLLHRNWAWLHFYAANGEPGAPLAADDLRRVTVPAAAYRLP
jgi:hypothetical protein